MKFSRWWTHMVMVLWCLIVGYCHTKEKENFLHKLLGSPASSSPVCPPDLFNCEIISDHSEHPCIPSGWVCDGDLDCPDGRDERQNCSMPTCSVNNFQCNDNQCIPNTWKCDGDRDCGDGSDESLETCQTHKRVSPGYAGSGTIENARTCLQHLNHYQCPGTGKCINATQLCDGIPDCEDAIDEGQHCSSRECLSSPSKPHMLCKEAHKSGPQEKGVFFFCEEGYFLQNGTTCVDLDECQFDFYCDQQCTNTDGSYTCTCGRGYRLEGKGTCKVTNREREPTLLFSTYYGIEQRWTNGSQRMLMGIPYLINASKVVSFDLDLRNQTVCWVRSDVSSNSFNLKCAKLNQDPSVTWDIPMQYSLTNVKQVAKDSISGNWYFTDDKRAMVFVCNATGEACRTITSSAVKRPKALALDPAKGYIFLGEWGERPSIVRCDMTGENFKIIVDKKIVRPQAISIDHVHQHVYWHDSYLNVIERTDYSGTPGSRRIIMYGNRAEHIFGLTVFENTIYTTSQQNSSILAFNRVMKLWDMDNKPNKIVGNLSKPGTIHLYHELSQAEDPGNGCSSNNGGCQHLCIKGTGTKQCMCKEGYQLKSDGRTCMLNIPPTFLLYANGQQGFVKGINLSREVPPPQVIPPIHNLQRPMYVDFHAAKKKIYFSDPIAFSIGRRSVGVATPESWNVGNINKVQGLAVDWTGNNIFWGDDGRKAITVAKIDNPAIRKTLITGNMSAVRDVVVDPAEGLLFWSDLVQNPQDGKMAKIELAHMDGTGRRVLVSDYIQWPNSVFLDRTEKKVYWIDAHYDRIECIDYSGQNRRLLYGGRKEMKYPYGLLIHQEYIYWSELSTGQIKRFRKTETNKTEVVTNDGAPVFGIALYDSSAQNSTTACSINNNGCSQFCLAVQGETPRCACGDGWQLEGDKVTCNQIPSYTPPPLCKEDQFPCRNDRCIPTQWRCDGEDDCGDNSDEEQVECASHTCKPEEYKCSDNRCIFQRWMCDGEEDCTSGEDENFNICQNITCGADHMKCAKSERCIPISWKCDHDNDCGDNSDEPDECVDEYPSCGVDQFTCDNKRCISMLFKCDRENDCSDYSDERDCVYQCANDTEFQCKNGHCISMEYKCDRDDNCGDGSDEQNCTALSPGICNHDDEWPCRNGDCIPRHWKCDGDDDCGDGSDERECDYSNQTCGTLFMMCPKERKCIPLVWKCDGEADCDDNSDEMNCTVNVVRCPYPSRHCKNDSTVCIQYTQLCDNNADCADESDEYGTCDVDTCANSPCSHVCSRAPDGFVCSCPSNMKIMQDNMTCTDAFPCERWGACSQNCTNTKDGFKCSCYKGYELDPDGWTCQPSDKSMYIIFSNRHELRRLDLDGQSYVSLVSGLRNTIALDYYYKNKTIFWTDVVDDKIYKGVMVTNSITKITEIVSVGLATAEGLAVDWIGENIYWVESNLDQIEVATLEGKHRSTLVAGGIESPRAIALDPSVGMLFWTDWDNSQPRIESCSMSGQGRRVVVNVTMVNRGAGWPNGLTLDYDLRRVYWIDARSDSINTVKYDGTDLREVLRGHDFLSHPFAVSIFASKVYWTDWRTNALMEANKYNGSSVRVIQRTITQPFDLHVYHPKRQPQFKNPCGMNNGGCSHLCLLSFNGAVGCGCPHLYYLQSDNKTCIFNDTFLLYARPNEIRGVYLNKPDYNIIPAFTVPHVEKPSVVDFDPLEGRLYWTDTSLLVINSASINGAGIETIIDTDLRNPSGFTVDYVSRIMFFGSYSSGTGVIWVCRLDGAYRRKLIDKRKQITSLAIHPYEGKIFWAESTSEPQAIFVAKMDGSDVQQLLPNKMTTFSISKPDSLTVDLDDNKLYFINKGATPPQIIWCNLDGSGAHILSDDATLGDVLTLTVHRGQLYVATGSTIAKVNRNGTHSFVETIRANTHTVTSIKIYEGKNETGFRKNACSENNGGCDQLCVPVSNNMAAVCFCTAGFTLGTDGKTCIGIKSFLLFSSETKVLGISLNASVDSQHEAIPPISRVAMVDAVDFHAAKNYVLWVDSSSKTISRIHRDLTDRQTLVSDGISSVEGLAVDWIAENLYWTDSVLDVIQVSRLNGSFRRVLIASELDRPEAIVVHPVKGYVFWTDWGLHPRIERARLDGSDRRTIMNSTDFIKEPYGLTIDYDEEKLYWCDKSLDIICSSNFDGSEAKFVIQNNLTDPTSISIFGDYMYWTDNPPSSPYGAVMRAGKDGTNMITMWRNTEPRSKLNDVKVYDRRKQTGHNICKDDNGGCKELCLYIGNNSRTCHCSHGRVTEDGGCEEYDAFLLYSQVNSIQSLHLTETSTNTPIKAIENENSMKNVIGLSFDPKTKTIFFSDIQSGNIQSVTYSGTDFNIKVENVGSAEGLAYDPVFQELYWTSYTDSTINRISVSPLRITATRETVVRLSVEDHPRALAIDSCDSRMYWTNWNERSPSIQRAYLMGYDIESIITSNIKTPNGLAIDHGAQKLYWSDARLDKIERCNMDGSDCKIVIDRNRHLQYSFSLAVYGDYLYWTDWILRAVMRAGKYDGSELTRLKTNIPRQPMGLIAVANDTNDCHANPCRENNGNCQHVCSPDVKAVVHCSCFQGYQLDANNVTCTPLSQLVCADDMFDCSGGLCIPYELTCDDKNDCPDGQDESTTYCTYRKCPAGFFGCLNHRCVKNETQCDGKDDCGDNSDELLCRCKLEEFRCAGEDKCISASKRCNLKKDCEDASDEMGCPPVGCSNFTIDSIGRQPPGLIPCNTTTACILPSWRCDGYNDCWDNSDEMNCPPVSNVTKCPNNSSDFQCSNSGHCIPSNWKCDREDDCGDMSDEKGCDYSCASSQFQCHDGFSCIPSVWECDGNADCPDGSDEAQNCTNRTCKPDEHRCPNNGRCIPRAWMCDGDQDCEDGSDEHSANNCPAVLCDVNTEFQCQNDRCIKKSFYCDGDDDCGDNSDERSCTYHNCSESEWQCKNGKQCIPKEHKCNKYFDCGDQSDEDPQLCSKVPPCGGDDKYLCDNNVCINRTLLCNGKNDCGDFSDELPCSLKCIEGRNQCTQICRNKTIAYECDCFPGYRLASDKRTCKDIDECKTTYPCTHYCRNSLGSFACSCAKGYHLQADGRTCRHSDKVHHAVLLVANHYYIRLVYPNLTRKRLVSDLKNAVAIDFDWKEQTVYWSDVTVSGSNISKRSLNGTNVTETLHKSTLKNPDGIAVDWVGRNLYWCDKTTDTIEVSTLDGLYRKILMNNGLQEPRAIEVFPAKGYLFYTDWGEDAHIGRLGMDGTDKTKIITSNLSWPNAMTIDYITETIFWADARLDYIAMADLDGKNVRLIINGELPHIFALTTFEDKIYWTDWEKMSVYSANKFSGANKTNVTSFVHRPMDIHILHPLRQIHPPDSENPCYNNGGCLNLCLIKPGGKDRTCACPENHYLGSDKRTCLSNCTSSQFTCANTFKCIPFWWKCDGQDDCGDRSDEPKDCPAYHCRQPGLFQCHEAVHECISPTQICDGVKQCTDGSDEYNCAAYTCMKNQFKCLAGRHSRCISMMQRCDGNNDCYDGVDEKDCPSLTCRSNQFQCANGKCIPYVWRCDKDNDCGDRSDEPTNCTELTCPDDYIKCNSTGRCIPNTWKCDGDNDCGKDDTSDEPPDECTKASCEPTYFRCSDNRCIPGRWRCDHDYDCDDKSDEMNCTYGECSESEWRCDSGQCIKNSSRCNQIKDCDDGSDEKCEAENCKETDFHCLNGPCIPLQWKCDNTSDCSDGSDEVNCPHACKTGEFKCGNTTKCIPQYWVCDGDIDCSDNSDEEIAMCKDHRCSDGRIRCNNTKCIRASLKCNGRDDCGDNSDESNCDKCRSDQFRCTEHHMCISMTKTCDGYNDCLDATDEDSHLCNGNWVCTHNDSCRNGTCNPNRNGCDCNAGFQFYNETYCVDKNECELWGYCDQLCTNLVGNHKCDCGPGYKLDRPLGHCKANDTHYILLAMENSLVAMNSTLIYKGILTPKTLHQTTNASRIEAMDVDVKSNRVYFVTSEIVDGAPAHFIMSAPIPKTKSLTSGARRKRGTESTTGELKVKLPGVSQPRGLAVDWVHGLLYWTDAAADHIQVAHIANISEARATNLAKRKTIIDSNLDQPHSIVVDPESSRIFWTDWGLNAKIESANLDGSDRKVLVNENVLWPTDLVIDYDNRRLYWTDPKAKTIETVNLNGGDRQIVKQFAKSEDPPYWIDVFEKELYVTSYKNHSIIKLDKFGKENSSSLHFRRDQGLYVGGVYVVYNYKQRVNIQNACSDVECGSNALCLPVAKCVCQDGAYKPKDSKTCLLSPSTDSCENFCQNRGTCIININKQPKCQCPAQYEGSRCQNDKCADFCYNGGTCSMLNASTIHCSCPPEYEGERCERYKCTDYCSLQGYCVVVAGMPTCVCRTGYDGSRCQNQKNPCVNHCYNDGQCSTDQSGRPSCVCSPRFTGKRCETCLENPNQCATSNATGYVQGFCYIEDGKTRCNCTQGYLKGPRCQYNVCHNYCKNNAHCNPISSPTGYVADCICIPQARYTGSRCENDRCDTYCNGQGRCYVDDTTMTLACKCYSSFAGKRCDVKVNCTDDYCLNGGHCLPAPSVAKPVSCQCAKGFKGARCDVASSCEQFICKHDGVCQLGQDGPECSCTPGWMGKHCDERWPRKCMDFCFNGGTCQTCTNSTCQSCRCTHGWSGSRCENMEISNASASSSVSAVAVAVPLCIIILVVLAIIVIVILFKRRKRNQFKHHRMDDTVTNPIYVREYGEDEDEVQMDAFDFEGDKPTNFANPMYETLYHSDMSTTQHDEKRKLLKQEDSDQVEFFGDDDNSPYLTDHTTFA